MFRAAQPWEEIDYFQNEQGKAGNVHDAGHLDSVGEELEAGDIDHRTSSKAEANRPPEDEVAGKHEDGDSDEGLRQFKSGVGVRRVPDAHVCRGATNEVTRPSSSAVNVTKRVGSPRDPWLQFADGNHGNESFRLRGGTCATINLDPRP